MSATVNSRDLALAATSPRYVTVPLPSNVSVDLSDPSQAINNLPSYTRVGGVTSIATQSSLSYGGGYLTGFGILATQATLNLASQVTGLLANTAVSGLGALALVSSINPATQIAVGTLAAGVVYAGDIAASQITTGYLGAARIQAGTITVDKLASNSAVTLATGISFGLGVRWDADSGGSGGYTAVVGRATSATTFGGSFTQSATNGYGLIAAATGGAGAAAGFLGNWTAGTATRDNAAYLGTGVEAGYFEWNPSVLSTAPQWARLGSSTYGLRAGYSDTFRGTIGTSSYAGRFGAGASGADTRVVELANGNYAIEVPSGGGSTKLQGFACNGATPQGAYTLNAASTDLTTVVALCNQIRTALINNGICA